MPEWLTISNTGAKGTIKYSYSADGSKLRTEHIDNNGMSGGSKTTDYVGNRIYEGGSLKRTMIEGGYIEGSTYHFYLTDHLGNNRVVANGSGAVIQKNAYYPFGMAFATTTAADQDKQPFKYGAKELDRKFGLNNYDFEARHYDPAYARFTTVDPMAEKYYSWSPYTYCFNNPLKFIDPTGEEPESDIDEDKQGFWMLLMEYFESCFNQVVMTGNKGEVYKKAADGDEEAQKEVQRRETMNDVATVGKTVASGQVTPYVSISVGKESAIGAGLWGSLIITSKGVYLSGGSETGVSITPSVVSGSISAGVFLGPVSGIEGFSAGSSAGVSNVGVSATSTINSKPTISVGVTVSTSHAWGTFQGGYAFPIYKSPTSILIPNKK